MPLKTGKLQFGDFILDEGERILTRDGVEVAVPPKALLLLSVLIENCSHIVEKEMLIERIWGETFVEEGNLAYTVRLLRKALGDDPNTPKFIQTIPRRGYRFVASVCTPTEINNRASQATGSVELENERGGLIGREAQIREITELLGQIDVRLITLTGTGGTGKTRLAKEIAMRFRGVQSDEVFYVDLASVADPAMVLTSIAHSLSVRDDGQKSVARALEEFFQGRRSLLVLDNFEQVVNAGPGLALLLKKSAGLKILVTSREPLKLSGETEYHVPPLSLPPPHAQVSLPILMRSEAARLFIKRAQQVRPDFGRSQTDVVAIAAICNKLDGLPLALELAAVRVKVLTSQQILSKLSDSLSLLTGGPRDLPERQQTMRATIEWSYELLAASEKDVFVRLSVFQGGFTIDAAEVVISRTNAEEPSRIGHTKILDAVTSLVDKNLLLLEKSVKGDLRFRMLVVVRDFALEILVKSGEFDKMRCLHAEYFLNLSEEALPYLRASGLAEWLTRLEAEHDNIRAAIRWALKNDPEIAARIATAVRHLWTVRGHIREGRHLLDEISKKAGKIPSELRWELLTGLGNMAQFQGDFEAARGIYKISLDESRVAGDRKHLAQALRGVGAIDYMQSDFLSARERVDEALTISREIDDEFGEAAALARLGCIFGAEGKMSKARSRTIEALEIFRRLDYSQGVAAKLSNLAVIEFLDGDYASARSAALECLNISLGIGDEIDLRVAFEVYAALSLEDGDLVKAARLAGAATARGEAIDYLHEPMERGFRDLYLNKLQAAMCARDFDSAMSEGKAMNVNEAAGLVLEVKQSKETNTNRLRLVDRRSTH